MEKQKLSRINVISPKINLVEQWHGQDCTFRSRRFQQLRESNLSSPLSVPWGGRKGLSSFPKPRVRSERWILGFAVFPEEFRLRGPIEFEQRQLYPPPLPLGCSGTPHGLANEKHTGPGRLGNRVTTRWRCRGRFCGLRGELQKGPRPFCSWSPSHTGWGPHRESLEDMRAPHPGPSSRLPAPGSRFRPPPTMATGGGRGLATQLPGGLVLEVAW